MAFQQLTLAGLKEGALEERFQHELARVLENIRDPNTDSKAKRSIKIEVFFTPGEDRDQAHVVVRASSKLASLRGVGTYVEIRKAGTELVALEPFTVEPDRQPEIPGIRAVPSPLPPAIPTTATVKENG